MDFILHKSESMEQQNTSVKIKEENLDRKGRAYLEPKKKNANLEADYLSDDGDSDVEESIITGEELNRQNANVGA